MISNTDAYGVWRSHSQQMLDFAILVTTAAPQLAHALGEHDQGKPTFLATNPGFQPSATPYATERRALSAHEDVMGATLLLSVFSYFETYVFSAIDEILKFHGGEDAIEKSMRSQLAPQVWDAESATALSRLRHKFTKNRADRFRKFTRQMRGKGLAWPSQRFMLFGLKQAVAQQDRWRAHQIPDLAADLLALPFTADERKQFHKIRNDRNHIAHGKALKFDLKKAVQASKFLRDLAMKIDQHVVEHFLLVERYAH